MVVRRRDGNPEHLSLLLLLALCAFVLVNTSPASAAGIVARDGKIHACYKAKGKGKGTLRVVRNAKVRCPKRWKKVAWSAHGAPGAQGEQGPRGESGATGATGATGTQGAPGRNENVVVNELEDKVTELLTKVQSLEAILNGINNTQLKEAIAGIAKTEALEAVVGSLCTQATNLTEQSNELRSALGALNTTLDTLVALFSPVPLPTALLPYSCP